MVWTRVESQTVAVNDNVRFNYAEGNCDVTHRADSGLFTLHGGKKYAVTFGANVTGATAQTELALALSINGETMSASTMNSTPTVANTFNNVGRCLEIKVPCGCCYNIGIKNIGTTEIVVEDAYLSIRKEN